MEGDDEGGDGGGGEPPSTTARCAGSGSSLRDIFLKSELSNMAFGHNCLTFGCQWRSYSCVELWPLATCREIRGGAYRRRVAGTKGAYSKGGEDGG